MPELKTLLITVLQDLINNLVYSVTEVHTFFPLKDSVSDIVYLYRTDCKIDIENTSLENINVSIAWNNEYLNVSNIFSLNNIYKTLKTFLKMG